MLVFHRRVDDLSVRLVGTLRPGWEWRPEVAQFRVQVYPFAVTFFCPTLSTHFAFHGISDQDPQQYRVAVTMRKDTRVDECEKQSHASRHYLEREFRPKQHSIFFVA